MGFRQPSADFLGNRDGAHGELLVRALGLHLKGLRRLQIVPQICLNGLKNRIHILFAGAAPAQADHAENTAAGLPGAVHIRHVIQRLHIDRRLHDIHIKIPVGLHSAPDILTQAALKLPLIGALQNDFPKF